MGAGILHGVLGHDESPPSEALLKTSVGLSHGVCVCVCLCVRARTRVFLYYFF